MYMKVPLLSVFCLKDSARDSNEHILQRTGESDGSHTEGRKEYQWYNLCTVILGVVTSFDPRLIDTVNSFHMNT